MFLRPGLHFLRTQIPNPKRKDKSGSYVMCVVAFLSFRVLLDWIGCDIDHNRAVQWWGNALLLPSESGCYRVWSFPLLPPLSPSGCYCSCNNTILPPSPPTTPFPVVLSSIHISSSSPIDYNPIQCASVIAELSAPREFVYAMCWNDSKHCDRFVISFSSLCVRCVVCLLWKFAINSLLFLFLFLAGLY